MCVRYIAAPASIKVSLIAVHKSMTGITEVHGSLGLEDRMWLKKRLIGRFFLSGRKASFERHRRMNFSGAYL